MGFFQSTPFIVNTTERERELNPDVLLKGYCIELLQELERELGFKSDVYLVEDGNYGGIDEDTNQWNGMIGDIYRRVTLMFAFFRISSNVISSFYILVINKISEDN